MFETVAIDSVGRWDVVIWTAVNLASVWIVDFLGEVEILVSAG
jgi:hypothetical protein